MTRTPSVDSPTTAIAPVAVVPFGPPALLEGEDAAAYDELLLQISSALKPADTLEEIWAHECVDLTWEVLRWRRLKAALLAAQAQRGLKRILRRLMDDPEMADRLAERWATRRPSAVSKVNRLLASAGLTMDAIQAETLTLQLDALERLDRMAATAELRRNAVLRELEHHRTSLASSLRRANEKVENIAYQSGTLLRTSADIEGKPA